MEKRGRAWTVDVWLGISTNENFLCKVMNIMNIRFLIGEGALSFVKFDIHESVHRNINLIERTNKMRLCTRTYYSIVS
jgi:hypothetical protein